MNWIKKKILVVVKSYPERSKKHGSVVCTAGITEDGEWIRIYPVPFEFFRGSNRIPKYTWIEAEVKKASGEKLNRKESHKVRDGSIRIVDDSLTKRPTDWESRNKYVLPMISNSIEDLQNAFSENNTSLGLVKPKKVFDFYRTKELVTKVDDDILKIRQKTLEDEDRTLLEELPHIFKYQFSCNGKCKHNLTCEDWELFQSYRSWRWRYKTPEILWDKIYQRYYTKMIEKCNLYFYLGTHSMYPVWMIIGLFYPPK